VTKKLREQAISYKDYVAGWLDSSIHDFLELFPGKTVSMKYALITCLDSATDPASMLDSSPELAPIVGQAKVLKKGLLLPTRALIEANRAHGLFFGFDEIWFFPHDNIQPKPDSAWLVGPDRVDQTKLSKLGPWMMRNSSSLGLGDGQGLNVVIKARGLIRHLLAQTIHQPEPVSA
jgi:hypothetical protein